MIADSSKPKKLRNVYTIRETARNVTIQKRKIYYIKIKVIALIINFRRKLNIIYCTSNCTETRVFYDTDVDVKCTLSYVKESERLMLWEQVFGNKIRYYFLQTNKTEKVSKMKDELRLNENYF